MNITDVIEAAARAAHETNRAYCMALGDTSQFSWELAPESQRESVRIGARGVLVSHNTPRQSHDLWLKTKQETGWVLGPVKNHEKKEHPCLLPYDALPMKQRLKDDIFVAVVLAVGRALMSNTGAALLRAAGVEP